MGTRTRTETSSRSIVGRFRRPAAAVLAGSLIATLALSGTAAEAQTIESLRARAAQLSNELESLEQRSAVLNEKYLETESELSELESEQQRNEAAVSAAKAGVEKTRGEASAYVVQAYVGGGANDPLAVGSADPNEVVNQKVLLRMLKGDRDAVASKMSASQEDLEVRSADLKRSGDALEKKRDEQKSIVDELEAGVARHSELVSSANSELNAAVAAERQRREAEAAARAAAEAQAAAQRAEAARTAAAQAAATAPAAPAGPAARRAPRQAAPAPAAAPGRAAAPAPAPAPASAPSSGAAGAIAAAKSRLGTPYRWGGTTPAGFDCSGLMLWSYAQVGISLPRTSGAQRAATQRISFDQLQPGDLVFSGNPVHHVGMYIGGGQMIHSPQTGDVVKISPVRVMGNTHYGRIG